MFHITQNDRYRANNTQILELLKKFDADDMVYQGDAGDWLIGDCADFNEDEIDGEYGEIGTVAELVSEYEDRIAELAG